MLDRALCETYNINQGLGLKGSSDIPILPESQGEFDSLKLLINYSEFLEVGWNNEYLAEARG